MSTHSNDPDAAPEGEDATGREQDPVGVEIGITDGEGSTFEPEEDPEAQGT
ncbi:hypothetical protein [Nocardioides xinjiangensis]|uniref:hypothetical protein n=1 Tax=Nocardioides xinjiangensis TaxID=2817376 RepID=UPI001B30C1C2|nr:hypothetical protein [Nocardioides sp. SYSU D00514]